MADLKPLGSEKLQGNDKIKRILELSLYNTNTQKNKQENPEFICESNNGFFGIVKEKDGYYVKKGLTENTLDYIGGMFMKNKNRFPSYALAYRRLEYLKGQEILEEEKKYVLKVNKGGSSSAPLTPPPANMGADEMTPSLPPESDSPDDVSGLSDPDTGSAPIPGGEEKGNTPPMPDGEEGNDDNMNGDEKDGDESVDPLKGIQKLTGRLGQKIRSHKEDMESEDIKYILNSVLSALDLNKLDDEDKDDVLSKFDGDDEDMGDDMNDDDSMGDEEPTGDEFSMSDMGGEEPEMGSETDMSEVMDTLENLTNTSFDLNSDDFSDDSEPCSWCGYRSGHSETCPYKNEDEQLELGEQDDIPTDEFSDDEPYSNGGTEIDGEDWMDQPNEWDEDESVSKEIDITELTDMIQTSVKETLGKYFE